jgi:hypothetical protein
MRSKLIPITIVALMVATSCKKETGKDNLKAVFSYSVNGFVVTFQNFTDFTDYTGPYAQFEWAFGDGDSSSAASPSHVYSAVGKYIVTLTAVKSKQKSTFFDTVTVVGPHIVIDGDFSDWGHVGYTYLSPDSTGGSSLLAIKTFASGEDINFYIEGTSNMNFAPTDMYFNTDNNAQTGFADDSYPAGSGADFLYEGDLYDWGTISVHTGAPADFSWNMSSDFGEGAQFSQIVDLPNGKRAIEFSFAKSALGNVKDSLGFAIIDLDAGWNPIGAIPAGGQDTSKYFKIGW